jgi:hypothetical protein
MLDVAFAPTATVETVKVVEVAPPATIAVAWKVAVALPASTVTDVGTVAEAALDDSDTTMPPDGAGPVRVTVPVELVPPNTVFGLNASPVEASVGGVTATDAVLVLPPSVAVIVADPLAA